MRIEKVCCYGSGLIGSGWATNFILAGVETKLYDLSDSLLQCAKETVQRNLQFFVDEKTITAEQMEAAMSRLILTADPADALRGVQFVQENTPERLEIKRSVAAAIEKYCPDTAIIASSTSGLRISDIAEGARHPERFVGAHPYNPVYLIPLVELTRSFAAADSMIEDAAAFYREIRMEPIILNKEVFGFISNRLQYALYREAAYLVCRGVCSMEDVDRAAVFGPGLRWALLGPNMVYELGGGEGGIEGLLNHMMPTFQLTYEDMCTWTEFPQEYVDSAQAQMNAIMKSRDPKTGNTHAEIEHFRDRGLLMLLRHHGKFG